MSASLHLIVRLAGERVAFPALDVEAVIDLDQPTAVPRAAAHVVGLAAQRSRVLTVIDPAVTLGLVGEARRGPAQAVTLHWEGHAYALLVDGVDDAVEIEEAAAPMRLPAGSPWARVARGIVEHDGVPLLVVAPALLVGGNAPQPARRPGH